MFQPYRMKYLGTRYSGRGYRYKNCSIFVTNYNGVFEISICPHIDINLPDQSEVEGILYYLGLQQPYTHSIFQHRGIHDMGDTHYYRKTA